MANGNGNDDTLTPKIVDETKEAGFGNRFGTFEQPPIGMIIHHTGGGKAIDQVIRTYQARGFPAQFVIGRDGTIYQTLPDGAQGRQIQTGWGSVGSGKSNANTEGVEVIADNDGDVTAAQQQAAARLVVARGQKWGYDPQNSVWGHGEVNPGHKEPDEGRTITAGIRDGSLLRQVGVPQDQIHDAPQVVEPTPETAAAYSGARRTQTASAGISDTVDPTVNTTVNTDLHTPMFFPNRDEELHYNPFTVAQPEPTGHPMTAPLQPDTSGLRVGMPPYGTPETIVPFRDRPAGAPPGGSPTNPAAVNVQKAIASLQQAGASPAFIQAALNQPYYEGGWRVPWFQSPTENSFGHLQFNDGGELPGYMDWVGKNAQGQDYRDTGLQFSYLASRVPKSVLNSDDPKAATDWLNNNFEIYAGHGGGQRYEHLDDAAQLMQGNYASVGGGTGSSPYFSGDKVPGTNYATGGALAFAPPSAQAPTITPGGGGGGGPGGGPGANPQLATPGFTPNPDIATTRDQLAKSLQQGQGWQKLALAMSFLKPNVAPVVNYNPAQVFQPQPVHFSSNPVDDNIVQGGGGLSSMYMRFRPEQVPGYLFSQG